MSAWAPKRFWQNADAVATEGGYKIMLDDRQVLTPAKAALVVPTFAMAEIIAAEWQAQFGIVRPETMPYTRSANSAIDRVATQFEEVADLIAAYGATDLLCYRAETPQALVARQAAGWDPLLDWSARALNAPLNVTAGIVPIDQPQTSISALTAIVHAMSPFQLAGLHDLVAISGSLVIGCAITHRRIDATEGWRLSRIDEIWQIEQWGTDEEAAESEAIRQTGFLHADRFYALSG